MIGSRSLNIIMAFDQYFQAAFQRVAIVWSHRRQERDTFSLDSRRFFFFFFFFNLPNVQDKKWYHRVVLAFLYYYYQQR